MSLVSFSTGALGSSLIQGAALLASVAISVALYHYLTVSSPVRSFCRLIGLVLGAQVSIFIMLWVILPEGLIDEGEIIGPMLLTVYLSPLFWRLRRDSTQLARAKEMAEVTLTSIGDAVITTDLQGRVEKLNPVAEHLTGWKSVEAHGYMLEEVFHIINETTRNIVRNPARQAMEEGTIVELAEHTILVARDGRENYIEDSAAPIRDTSGAILGSVVVFRDVSHSRELVQKLSWQAGHDALTGLPNRALLADRLALAISHAERSGRLLLVALMDLDGFKAINDDFGHEAGDRLLSEAAIRMQGTVRAGDTVARLGGDEFVLLLTHVESLDDMGITLERIISVVSAPYDIDGRCLEISASVGVTVYPHDNSDADTLIRHADHAMYQVKQQGRRHYRLFDAELAHEDNARHQQLSRIRAGLVNGEFRLYYQPKVNMREGRIVGLEALLRWRHPERGMIGPLEFLPIAEQTDLGVEIDRWVLREALHQMQTWHVAGLVFNVSVNISARLLLSPDFIPYLQNLLRQHARISPNRLELEILETVALADLPRPLTRSSSNARPWA